MSTAFTNVFTMKVFYSYCMIVRWMYIHESYTIRRALAYIVADNVVCCYSLFYLLFSIVYLLDWSLEPHYSQGQPVGYTPGYAETILRRLI